MDPHQLPTTVYHVADASGWPAIEAYGLLTTASVLRRWEVDEEDRERMLTTIRPRGVRPLTHPELGTAWIRDQGRLTAGALEKSLEDGMSVEDWCRLLNSQIYFFPSLSSAGVLLNAYAERPQVLLGLRTSSLLSTYGSLLKLSRINSGSTSRKPATRGRGTFTSVSLYPGTPSTIKEVVVRADILDLSDHLISVGHREPGRPPLRLL